MLLLSWSLFRVRNSDPEIGTHYHNNVKKILTPQPELMCEALVAPI